jgi:hypothetical protein
LADRVHWRGIPSATLIQERAMSKGKDQKKEQKKKPASTLDEKRAAKKAKKAERSSGRGI